MVTLAAPHVMGTTVAAGNALSERDDAALVAAIAAGDAGALDLLYCRYRSLAYAAAIALLREPSAAEDALHDAFLGVWRGAKSFQPARGSCRAWLLTIVRHAAIDQLRVRRVASQPPDSLRDWIDAARDDATDVFAAVAGAADAGRLRAALRGLPPAQRDAVELAFFAGLTHGEIAARTGVPLGTVKGRVRLGLRRLRQDLRDLAPALPQPSLAPQ
jgi:RNA polymerase sigma-70 factor (ECF subfamily)